MNDNHDPRFLKHCGASFVALYVRTGRVHASLKSDALQAAYENAALSVPLENTDRFDFAMLEFALLWCERELRSENDRGLSYVLVVACLPAIASKWGYDEWCAFVDGIAYPEQEGA